MIFLKALFIVIEALSSLLLIGLILLQRSKSEGLGLAFGASTGESLFGARAGNVLSKATVVLGITFLACTLILGVLFAQKDVPLIALGSDEVDTPAAVQAPPQDFDLGTTPMEPVMGMETIPDEEPVTVPVESM